MSTQDTAYQQEAVARLHLPFPLLSDERLELTTALSLPTFEVDGMTLIKRLTLIIDDGAIETSSTRSSRPTPTPRTWRRGFERIKPENVTPGAKTCNRHPPAMTTFTGLACGTKQAESQPSS